MKPNQTKGRLILIKYFLDKWVFILILILLIWMAAYFRFRGLYWGEEQYLHPDERFLVWVGSDISPVPGLEAYFDTATSSLNPHNRGHGFFVYGTLPLFIARYLVEWIYGHSGFNEMTLVGRPLSAIADLGTMILVYLVASQLYKKKVALLATAFYACAVLPIQLSHFYKEDTFVNFFTLSAVYFSVRVLTSSWGINKNQQDFSNGKRSSETTESQNNRLDTVILRRRGKLICEYISSPLLLLSIGFGIALGCAVASKLTAVPVAMMLPTAFVIKMFSNEFKLLDSLKRQRRYLDILVCLSIAAIVSFVIFRWAQPYAFSGPGFFGLKPNPQWVANILEQRTQSTGDVDFPPALQWARRSKLFSLNNMILWGLGLPLGLLSWAGFALIGWRIIRGSWRPHILLWGWTFFYFLWQASAHNPTMRYQLPIYPTLVIFASWLVGEISKPNHPCRSSEQSKSSFWLKISGQVWLRYFGIVVGGVVLITTIIWAYSFSSIYNRPITRVEASRWIYQNVPGPINLQITQADGVYNQPIPFQENVVINQALPSSLNFEAKAEGQLQEINFTHISDIYAYPQQKTLEIKIRSVSEEGVQSRAEIVSDFLPSDDPRGDHFTVRFSTPILIKEGKTYQISLILKDGNGQLAISGSAPANESSWDDGLPLRIDGYDGYGGIYQRDLVFEMYWDDNTEKLLRFINILEQSDYIFISSNRQWGTTTRVPERYPLTSLFYRHLLGCPIEKGIIWCYNIAQVGTFPGGLGFDLVQVFESFPTFGILRINDQFAEEAFTVYDHPKVFIFKKTNEFDILKVSDILGSVDLTKVIHVTPKQATRYPGDLMLPAGRWIEQQVGGTWSNLFNSNEWVNRYQVVGVIIWYFSITLLGLIVYPMVRMTLSGLPDKGYPFVRIIGMLVISYMVWLAGSYRIAYNSTTISLAICLLVIMNGFILYKQRIQVVQDWRTQKNYYILVELIFLFFFILDLLIRFGNPDLWHPWKGGEKPMDFAYLNAVLKSTSFPAYDPWFAGGYLNYYYYGFVIFSVLVKWLGIIPSFAYNLIIPTIFSMIALGAFSIGWNLIVKTRNENDGVTLSKSGLIAGLSGALGMAVLGNLGIVRMLIEGFQKVVAPQGIIDNAGFLKKIVWSVRGFFKVLSGSNLPYGIGDWYWNPSRVIPAPNEVEPITEFPFFTVLYADPHAHLFALPIALLVLAFVLAIVIGWRGWSRISMASLALGGLAIGSLRPTNTWDFYTYLCLGCVAVISAQWIYHCSQRPTTENQINSKSQRDFIKKNNFYISVIFGVFSLIGLSFLFFQPYMNWYGQGYSQIQLWKGSHTTFSAYFTHWGLFLFIVISWMAWESLDWMASTPVSKLSKLSPYKGLIYSLLVLTIISIVALVYFLEVNISWFVIPAALWAGVLILRPEQENRKRYVLFLIGTSFMLTLLVEVIVLRGDVARMNTVFKFYLQVWTLFAISAAGCVGWLTQIFHKWKNGYRRIWFTGFTLLIASAAFYPLFAGIAKVKDRMVEKVPPTLDGMLYMKYAHYSDNWGDMDLSQDYYAIRWMQENIEGSPVIVEANLRDLYRWGSRYSIYTGLPGVVGWEWHQQQQRAVLPGYWISDRITEIDDFYTTTDFYRAIEFLKKYNVQYIVLGQQERGHYAGDGLDKFTAANGILWQEVYHRDDTVIYRVLINDNL